MMHSISAILIKPFTKPFIKAGAKLICISLLLITQIAHADFRKALDAYQKRDGTTMFKEVKDAVDKKNDDGLMLLLMATNMDAATSDYDETTKQSKSTLRAILPQPKWDEMRELLVQATNNSTVDAQYYLLTSSQFRADSNTKITTDYVAKGSQLAMLKSTITHKAEAGNLEAQLALGFRYLNYENEFGCEKQSKDHLCQSKDEAEGYYWLKLAVKTYETSGNADYDLLPSVMCEFYRRTANGDQAKLKQAYLWSLKGLNERATGVSSYSMSCLHHMSDSQELKIIAPQLYGKEFGGTDFNSIVYRAELKMLPDLVQEVRKEIVKEELPVFIYYDGQELDVYANGRVLFGFANHPKDLLLKVKPKVVKAFLADIKKAGFNEWTTVNSSTGNCSDHRCKTSDMYVTLREGAKVKRIFFSILPEYLLGGEQASSNRKRMAVIRTLVNKYFPTQQLCCKLGNSEQKKQACLELDNQSAKIVKKEK